MPTKSTKYTKPRCTTTKTPTRVIGCGSQGHAHALNLQESEVKVVVGLRKGSATWGKVESVGLKVMETKDAAKQGDIIMMLVPDTAEWEDY